MDQAYNRRFTPKICLLPLLLHLQILIIPIYSSASNRPYGGPSGQHEREVEVYEKL